jgi:serine/threonine-protein kinase
VTPALPAGTELANRYTIEAPISSGGMGAVFSALDSETGGRVAIKHVTEAHAKRFAIEARLLAGLDHPRVVGVLDSFGDEGGMYLVMELVDGEDLARLLKQRGNPGLPVADAVAYGLEACEALRYVHDQQVVHRDIKPANLIAGADGVVLVDFGIARELAPEGVATVGIGTPRFIAPEVLSGGIATPRTDVFGLAATLWTLITGRTPPHGPLPSISAAVPGVGAELEQTLRAGLEVVPELRIESAEAFAGALGSPLGPSEGAPLVLSVARPRAPRELLEGIVRTAAGVFDAASASVALADRASGELVYQAAWGAGAKEIVGVRLARGEGIAGAVIETGAPEVVPDCASDPRFAAEIAGETGYVPNTMLVVPLERAGQTVGVLSVLDRRDGGSYGPREVEQAVLFAGLALSALGLEDARQTSHGDASAGQADRSGGPSVVLGVTRDQQP